jgi:hypothetical protein
MKAQRIDFPDQMRRLARKLGVRPDWHEPDEQEVTVKVHGDDFDNAGFWGHDSRGGLDTYGDGRQEIWVEIFQNDKPVAEINLATLLAMASGNEGTNAA